MTLAFASSSVIPLHSINSSPFCPIRNGCSDRLLRYSVSRVPQYYKTPVCIANETGLQETKETLKTSGGQCFDDLLVNVTEPSIRIREDRASDVLERTELLKIPDSLLLTPKSARSTLGEAHRDTKEQLETLPDEAVLALGLLYERHLGSASTFSALINELPDASEIDCAPLWSDDQLQWLFGSPIRASAISVRNGVNEEFLKATNIFTDADWLTSNDDYSWACAIVDSRAVRASQAMPLVLAPIVHSAQISMVLSDKSGDESSSSQANVDVSMSGFRMFSSRRNLLVTASRKISPGEQVILSAKGQGIDVVTTNGQLLLERGVVVDDQRARGGRGQLRVSFV